MNDFRDLRAAALKIYMKHTAASALDVKNGLVERKDKENTKVLEAADMWLRYSRNAESWCGVYALAAVDRADSYLCSSLRANNSFSASVKTGHDTCAAAYCRAARCFVHSLMRQKHLDCNNEAL